MRDYQFLRNQLHRDTTMIVDVLSANRPARHLAGRQQDSRPLPQHARGALPIRLHRRVRSRLDEARCRPSRALEKWVAEEAGGLIAVAGPIQTADVDSQHRARQASRLVSGRVPAAADALDDGQYGGDTPWPLAFERAGREAKFLWLGKTAEDSEAAWDNFPGVFGYYAVKGEKPGATVYARFSDPEAGCRTSGPSTSPASSTARARSSTSAAANSGGCGASTRPTSKCSTPS